MHSNFYSSFGDILILRIILILEKINKCLGLSVLPSLTPNLVLVGATDESGSETKTSGKKLSAEIKTKDLNQRSTK